MVSQAPIRPLERDSCLVFRQHFIYLLWLYGWIGLLVQTKYLPARSFQPPFSAQEMGRTPESTHVFKGPTRVEGQGISGGETSGNQDCEQEHQQSPSDRRLVVGLLYSGLTMGPRLLICITLGS